MSLLSISERPCVITSLFSEEVIAFDYMVFFGNDIESVTSCEVVPHGGCLDSMREALRIKTTIPKIHIGSCV
jgi:hypothetical protein